MSGQYKVAWLCEALLVSRSGYYDWKERRRQPGPRQLENIRLRERIREEFARSRQAFASTAYRQLLAQHGLVASMSRKGNCYDNAFIESFFSSLKYELVYHHRFATRAQARTAIFDYIETFYNRTRLHSSLDYQSPINFESKLN